MQTEIYRDIEISIARIEEQGQTAVLIDYPPASAIIAEERGLFGLYYYMVEQTRRGCGCRSLEIPAGKCKSGESALDCARRELAEETGLTAATWKQLISYYPAIGISTEILTIFRAHGLTAGPAALDPDEDISLLRLSRGEVEKLLRSGSIRDAKTLLAFNYIF